MRANLTYIKNNLTAEEVMNVEYCEGVKFTRGGKTYAINYSKDSKVFILWRNNHRGCGSDILGRFDTLSGLVSEIDDLTK